MASLSIHFLGECQFIYEDEVVSGLQTKRLRFLLGYLLLHAGQQLSATQLAFLFWPDSPEKQARTNLRRQFFNLRKAFPQCETFLVRTDHTVIWLAEGDYELDVDHFQRRLDQAEHALEKNQIHLAREALTTAINDYHGALLPDCYDDGLLVYREQLRQRYLTAIEQLMELLGLAGEYRLAITYGERLLREDSLREQPYRALMTLHALNGDRANALRVYHACAPSMTMILGCNDSG